MDEDDDRYHTFVGILWLWPNYLSDSVMYVFTGQVAWEEETRNPFVTLHVNGMYCLPHVPPQGPCSKARLI